MKHRIFGNQLHRKTNAAKALYRGLVAAVLEHGKIETTLARAKAVQGEIDQVINLVKENSVNSRRELVKKMGREIKVAKNFGERTSGYTRIFHLGQRFSDAAEMVTLELIEDTKPEIKPTETKVVSGETKVERSEIPSASEKTHEDKKPKQPRSPKKLKK